MTFARLAKLLAVLLVAFALWRAKPPASPARAAVLVLPGATVELLSPGARAADGVAAQPVTASGAEFWTQLFAFGSDATGEPAALWSGSQAPVRALAVPARLFGARQETASMQASFVGSSAGAIVEAADLTSGRLPFPYDRAADAISTQAAALAPQQWSDWITVEPVAVTATATPAPPAMFQFARVTDTSYFFSPAYAVDLFAGGRAPFLRGLDRELRPLAAAHAIALSQRRLQTWRQALTPSSDLRPIVVFDSVAEHASDVFAPDSTPAVIREKLQDVIQAELAVLRAAVGSGGLVVVAGGPSMARETTEPSWYAVVGGGDHGGEIHPSRLTLEVGRVTLRYLAGVAIDAREKTLVPATVTGRVRIRPTIAAPPAAATPQPPRMEWSARTLESVPGAVDGGR